MKNKKNLVNITEEFIQNNFIMIVSCSDKISPDWNQFPKEEYFDEMNLSINFYIPTQKVSQVFYELSFSYNFEFYHQGNGKCEIVFNDSNYPTLNLALYDLTNKDNIEPPSIFNQTAPIREINFLDFATAQSIHYFQEEFAKIDEKFFFNSTINKKKVDLNQTLLKGLKTNFQKEIISVVTKLIDGDNSFILKRFSHIEKAELEDLITDLKSTDTLFNYYELNKKLNSDRATAQIKKHKI